VVDLDPTVQALSGTAAAARRFSPACGTSLHLAGYFDGAFDVTAVLDHYGGGQEVTNNDRVFAKAEIVFYNFFSQDSFNVFGGPRWIRTRGTP
jgi:hypothetical protein